MRIDQLPEVIQGGMGIRVSGWRLASSVARLGGIGVVSGTAIEIIMARTLEVGDPGGHFRHALARFPIPEVAERVLSRYFHEKPKELGDRFIQIPKFAAVPSQALVELTVCANFAEVYLAKEGHSGMVGINLLEKVQPPHVFALYGAMLADVDCVLMGAGIPMQVPGLLDGLAHHKEVSYRLYVIGALPTDDFRIRFHPLSLGWANPPAPLHRPDFFPIVSSHSLAKILLAKASGTVNGFVVELPTAGGHNAPPRGKLQKNDRGEPIYGERDEVNWEALRKLGVPFWIGGSYGSHAKLKEAQSRGAAGIQSGSIFALCEESGMDDTAKRTLRSMAFSGTIDIYTDPIASPSGFPFKVANLPDSIGNVEVYAQRPRLCDIGRLTDPYRKANGAMGFRCPAEDVDDYVAKGGKIEDTVGRKCLCSGLATLAGFPQRQPHGYLEAPISTLGDDVSFVHTLMDDADDSYTAEDAFRYLAGDG